MLRSVLFFAVASIALVYLLVTSPPTVNQVCEEVAAVAEEIGDAVTAAPVQIGGAGSPRTTDVNKDRDAGALPPLAEALSARQRAARQEVMADLPVEIDNKGFPVLEVTDPVNPIAGGTASLEGVTEAMEKIYLKNSVGR